MGHEGSKHSKLRRQEKEEGKVGGLLVYSLEEVEACLGHGEEGGVSWGSGEEPLGVWRRVDWPVSSPPPRRVAVPPSPPPV